MKPDDKIDQYTFYITMGLVVLLIVILLVLLLQFVFNILSVISMQEVGVCCYQYLMIT